MVGHRESLCAGLHPDGDGADPTGPGYLLDLCSYPPLRVVSGRHPRQTGGDPLPHLRRARGGAWKSGKLLKPYQKARLTSFMDPDNDPKGSGYQIRQSLIAVGSGGIWGKGTNKGTQTQGDFLPIPYTDFIFAAFCEEHGFIGAVGVLLLYFLILMRLIQNAQTAADLPGTFIVMGVVGVIVFQIAVNVGMVVGLMPVTGIPLPLLSYGGSSVLFTFLALGIVMNVRMRRFVN